MALRNEKPFTKMPNAFLVFNVTRRMSSVTFSFVCCLSLLLNFCSYGQHVPQRTLDRYPSLIQGKWQSLDDPQYVVLITKSNFKDLYTGFPTTTRTYRITNTCPDPSAPASGSKEKDTLVTYLPDSTGGTTLCYGIDQLTETRLTLIYLGRGNSLRFKRIAPAQAPASSKPTSIGKAH
jgi:hypothetical protein